MPRGRLCGEIGLAAAEASRLHATPRLDASEQHPARFEQRLPDAREVARNVLLDSISTATHLFKLPVPRERILLV